MSLIPSFLAVFFFSSFYIDIYPIFFLDSKTYSEYSNALSFLSRIVFLLYFRDVPCDFVSLQSCDYVRYNLSCRMSKEGHENGIKLVAGAQKQKSVVGDLNAPSNRAHVTVMLRPRIGIKWWAPVWSLFFPDPLIISSILLLVYNLSSSSSRLFPARPQTRNGFPILLFLLLYFSSCGVAAAGQGSSCW